MKKSPEQFLASCALVIVVSLSFVASFNYHYDPANIFGDRTYEAGIASLMVDGRDVANLSDYDERLVQKFFAQKLNAPREVLVIGSSRTMNLVPKYFQGASFYNASVSGASLEDIYAILHIYREKKFLPKRLILGIDPWTFNRFSGQMRWKSLEEEYARSHTSSKDAAHLNNNLDWQFASRLSQLISFDYFRAALKIAVNNHERDYYETDAAELDVNIRRADGSITYKRSYANRSVNELREWVSQQARQSPIYSLGRFSVLDKEYSDGIEQLLNRLSAEGVQVTLFLAPYHPDMYTMLTRVGSPYLAVPLAEQHLRALSKRQGLKLLGSFNPMASGCGELDFYDEMHPKPSCLDKIMFSYTTQPTSK